ncbi:MAG: hypothetical protein KatS3mg024_1597 [Armatimonadota bacterium]|nr:MAG: hypothetical protein KatS3mg024_1597 [Armatimonadota bacterium]
MSGRAVRTALAMAGAVAIVGQLAAYTVLARLDPAGVSRRVWQTDLDGGHVRITHPGNWKLSASSRGPDFRVVMEGPGGVRMEVSGSPVLKAVSEAPEEGADVIQTPLQRAHRALQPVARRGLQRFSEGKPVGSGALGQESLLSFYSAIRGGQKVRGFRHTCIGKQWVWSVQGECPARIWGRVAPLLDRVVRQMELP